MMQRPHTKNKALGAQQQQQAQQRHERESEGHLGWWGLLACFCLVVFLFRVLRRDDDEEGRHSQDAGGEQGGLQLETDLLVEERGLVLFLASHGRFVRYNVERNDFKVILQRGGVYYGTLPAPLQRSKNAAIEAAWIVSRNLTLKRESLILVPLSPVRHGLQTNAIAGEDYIADKPARDGAKIINRIKIPTLDAHEALLSRDGRSMFVASAENGIIYHISLRDADIPLPLFYNASTFDQDGAKIIQEWPLFTSKQHVNTIAHVYTPKLLLESDLTLWFVLHNFGASVAVLAIFDSESSSPKIRYLEGIGYHNHGWVNLEGNTYISLSSYESALVKIVVPEAMMLLSTKETHFKPVQVDVLWQFHDPNGHRYFLKGLTIVNNVAYFGMSLYGDRDFRNHVQSSLGAFSLVENRLLWIRNEAEIGTRGLLNVISLPHVSFESTSRALNENDIAKASPLKTVSSATCTEQFQKRLHAVTKTGLIYAQIPSKRGFKALPLRFDVDKLVEEMRQLVDAAGGWTLREDIKNYFVLLVTQNGVATDESTLGPFSLVRGRLEKTPYFRQVFDSLRCFAGRSRLMMLPAGANLQRHSDRTDHFNKKGNADPENGYWGRRWRIHIPIVTHPSVIFESNGEEIHMEAGRAYLFDNSLPHSVRNPSSIDRVHLVIDTVASVDLLYSALEPSTTTPRFVNPLPDLKLDVIVENWVDAPVFSPMPASRVKKFLFEYLFPMIRQETVREQFVSLFDAFLTLWSTTKDPSTLKKLASKLVLDVSDLECSIQAQSGDRIELFAGPNALTASAISITDFVESFTRMLYYECAWSKSQKPGDLPLCKR